MFTKSISKIVSGVILFAALALGSAQAQQYVPYKGAAAGKVISREPINGGIPVPGGLPFRRLISEASGNFTHIGKSTVHFDQVVRLIVEDGVPYLIVDGTYTVTTANGDTLFGTFQNKQNFITNEFTTDVVTEGGTGRFANASGSLEGAGQFDVATDTFVYWLDGVISTVGSSKAK